MDAVKNYFIYPVFAIFVVIISLGCTSKSYRSLDQIRKSGELRVLTRTAGTTYYMNKDGKPVGFEYELVKAFAQHLGVKVNMVPISSLSDVLGGLNSGRGDIVASGLTDTESRRKNYLAGSGYLDITQKLVCNSQFKGKTLESLKDARLVIVKGSSYEENLKSKKIEYPDLNWETISDLSSGQILQLVWEGGPDCTVVDSHIASVNRRYMPELVEVMDISEKQQLVWYMNQQNSELLEEVEKWQNLPETKSLLNQLKLRYYGGNNGVERYDKAIFYRPPKRSIIRLFKEAQREI
ncbi:MAG: transporter substrate-binding domain-containing protein [Bdellovibrionales bacterium]